MIGSRRDMDRAAQPGDNRLDEVYQAKYRTLVRLAEMLVDQRELAEDIVQDAFAAAHRERHQVENLSTYVRTSVVNACRDEQRARARARKRPTPAVPGPVAETDYLRDVIRALPDRQRTALILRFYEDLPFDEIATAMRTRPSTARSLVRRALSKLREEIEP